MDWVFPQTKERYFLSPSQQPFLLSQSSSPPPPSPPALQSSDSFDEVNKISPSILLIIIILAVIFFISGLLHLLVRFLFRPTIRDPEDSDNVTALQGQLQQLFHLHDAGVDQSYIDTLPVFFYNAIMGLKKPFDCAVCLCEFEDDDKLRLLPKCSHAFHLECIDTWLLSHSTCPLCRGSLLPDFSPNDNCSPVVYVLESGSESSREIIVDRETITTTVHGTNQVGGGTNTNLGIPGEDELGASCNIASQKFTEIPIKDEVVVVPVAVAVAGSAGSEEKVLSVKLGKFRNLDAVAGGEGEVSNTNNNNLGSRRCFSMGSFEYVVDESSSLQVSIIPLTKTHTNKKPSKAGYRSTMSECDGHSCREGFKGFESVKTSGIQGVNGRISTENSVGRSKNESFSISKIWLRSKKEKPSSIDDSSRRAFSFRFPLNRSNGADDLKNKQSINNNSSRRTISEVDVGRWDHCVSELDYDEEVGSRNSLDSQSSLPSFARKTLLWLVGKQNKVVHSSFTPNV